MAILINHDVSILGGVSINQLYLRLLYNVDLSGKNIYCDIFSYCSKNAYLNNWQENIINVDGLPKRYEFSYNSSLNGDPLLYLHNKIKEKLSTDIYVDNPIIDPSTGEYVIDPSTGQLITESILLIPKFLDANDIDFVDLD